MEVVDLPCMGITLFLTLNMIHADLPWVLEKEYYNYGSPRLRYVSTSENEKQQE
jgi:hypothetical protein